MITRPVGSGIPKISIFILLFSLLFLMTSGSAIADDQTVNQVVTAKIVPSVQNNTVYVPIKKILDALSAQKEFYSDDEKLIINHGDRVIMMQLNNRNAKVNNEDFLLDSAPYQENNDFWVPLNFLSESLAVKAVYNSGNNTFAITTNPQYTGTSGPDYIPEININTDLSTLPRVPYLRLYTDDAWKESGETFIITASDSVRWKYTNTSGAVLLSNTRSATMPNTGNAVGVYADIFTEKGNYLKISFKNKNPWNKDYIDIPLNAIVGNDVGSVSVNVKRLSNSKNENYVIAHIVQSISGITLNRPHLYLPLYDEEKLSYIIYPRTTLNQDVRWKSSDVRVASVDQDGLVTGVKKGKATITVTSLTNGKSYSCQVEVVGEYYDEVVDLNNNPVKIKTVDIPIPKLLYRDKGLTITVSLKNKGEWNIPTQLDLLLANKKSSNAPWMSYSSETSADIIVKNENTIDIKILSPEGWENDVIHIPVNVKLFDPGRLIYIDVKSENEEISPDSFTFSLD